MTNQPAYSADGTWLANPVDNNWYNPANWSSGTVPEGGETATFAFSNITDVNILAGASLKEIVFDGTAGAYTITESAGVGLGVNGGIENDSGVEQAFVATTIQTSAGGFSFVDSSVVGPCTFTQQARNSNTGSVAAVTFEAGSLMDASAGNAIFHNLGASVAGGVGGQTNFDFVGATADQCTITNDGATVSGATGGATLFFQAKPSAGNATLIANGGTNGGGGGSFSFFDGSLGGTARLELFGNGYMDMSVHTGPSFSIGSIEGDGQIYLGKGILTVGTNNLSTTFSGVLHPGNPTGGSGTGALIKIGSGTLTLSGANLYTAGTTVSAGMLVVATRQARRREQAPCKSTPAPWAAAESFRAR